MSYRRLLERLATRWNPRLRPQKFVLKSAGVPLELEKYRKKSKKQKRAMFPGFTDANKIRFFHVGNDVSWF